MKEVFRGYFRPTNDAYTALWESCIFVPDTNVLLHLLRFKQQTRDEIIKIFKALNSRLWLPYWVGYEFLQGWRSVDHKNRDSYNVICEKINAISTSLHNLFDQYSRHQTIDIVSEKKKINLFFSELKESIDKKQKQHPSIEKAE